MLYVTARSIGQGRTAGVVSALGIGAGIFVHTFAVALGLSALLVSVPVAYEVVRYAGAAYLHYLGVRALLSKEAIGERARLRLSSLRATFRQGVVTNVLNPKVALYFLAFLPQFADPARGPVVWQIILLGLIFNTSGTLVNVGVAFVSGYASGWLKERPTLSRAQRWLTGGVFLALAVRLALPERR